MINQLKTDTDLMRFVVDECAENEICVTIDPDIYDNDFAIVKWIAARIWKIFEPHN